MLKHEKWHKDKSMGKTPNHSHTLTCALINRHLQEGDWALGICQGQTISIRWWGVEEEEEEGWAGLLWGMLSVHVQSTACQHLGLCMMDSCTERVRVLVYALVSITLNPLSFPNYKTLRFAGSFVCAQISSHVKRRVQSPSNSPQTDLWCRYMGI